MGISGLRIKMGEEAAKLESIKQPGNPSRKGTHGVLKTQHSFEEPAKHLYPSITQKNTIYPIPVVLETAPML